MCHVGAAVDIDLPSTPIDVAIPKSSTRRPAPQGITGTKGKSRGNDTAGEKPTFRIVVVGWIVGIGPCTIDDCRIVIRHVNGAGIRGLDGHNLPVALLS